MTDKPTADAQTPIVIRASDADRVTNLAIAAEDRLPQVAALLLAELNRAEVVPDDELPADIVTMQATVKFIDEANGVERTLQLVYPTEADFDAGRISILSLVGAGLLGLKAGQSIMWPDRAKKERLLRIIDVMQG
jgi:regulator of nucleoside diphosphate kinase